MGRGQGYSVSSMGVMHCGTGARIQCVVYGGHALWDRGKDTVWGSCIVGRGQGYSVSSMGVMHCGTGARIQCVVYGGHALWDGGKDTVCRLCGTCIVGRGQGYSVSSMGVMHCGTGARIRCVVCVGHALWDRGQGYSVSSMGVMHCGTGARITVCHLYGGHGAYGILGDKVSARGPLKTCLFIALGWLRPPLWIFVHYSISFYHLPFI